MSDETAVNYAIMRCRKLKSFGSIASSMHHCFRSRPTHNADPLRLHQNVHSAANSTDDGMGRLRSLLPPQRRKDAVLSIEYMISASPSWWKTASQEQQTEFFAKSREWIEEKFGADQVIVSSEHHDETTPHLSVLVVPLASDGRLCARDFIGGAAKLRADQTTFAKKVAHLGLKRGIENSLSDHKTIQEWYAEINRVLSQNVSISLDEPKFSDRLNPKAYLDQIKSDAEALISKAVKNVSAKDVQIKNLKKRISELEKTVDRAVKRAEEAENRAIIAEEKMEEVSSIANLFEPHHITARIDEIKAAEKQRKQEERAAVERKERERKEKEEAARKQAEDELKKIQEAKEKFNQQLDERRARQELERKQLEEETRQAELLQRQQAEIENEKKRNADEFNRRVDALPFLLQKAVGAARTFIEYALKVKNKFDKTEWEDIEYSAAHEAMSENGQEADDVYKALCQLSPIRADNESHAEVRDFIDHYKVYWKEDYEKKRAARDADYEL